MRRVPNTVGSAHHDDARLRDLLTTTIPRIKLRLGAEIDQANERPLPPLYASALDITTLNVILAEELAAIAEPVAAQLEADLGESVRRHGLLYDRAYRVRLWASSTPGGPEYTITSQAGHESSTAVPERAGDASGTLVEQALPSMDPDQTVLQGGVSSGGWEPGRWLLRVLPDGASAPVTYPIAKPHSIIGRDAEDSQLRATIVVAEAPRTMSRRQIALVWEPRTIGDGFRLYNVGGPTVHVDGVAVPGARASGRPLDLSAVDDAHTVWIAPNARAVIEGTGIVLWIESNDSSWDDPDATRLL